MGNSFLGLWFHNVPQSWKYKSFVHIKISNQNTRRILFRTIWSERKWVVWKIEFHHWNNPWIKQQLTWRRKGTCNFWRNKSLSLADVLKKLIKQSGLRKLNSVWSFHLQSPVLLILWSKFSFTCYYLLSFVQFLRVQNIVDHFPRSHCTRLSDTVLGFGIRIRIILWIYFLNNRDGFIIVMDHLQLSFYPVITSRVSPVIFCIRTTVLSDHDRAKLKTFRFL